MVPYYEQGRRMTMPEMEQRFGVNPRTLTPALRSLVHAGILNSRTGGSDRGYILARDPREISVYQIVQTIQGEPKVECCMEAVGCTNCVAARLENGRCNIFNKLNSLLESTRTEIGRLSLHDQYYSAQ